MTARELIQQLEKLHPDMPLLAYEPKTTMLHLIQGVGQTNFRDPLDGNDRMVPVVCIGGADLAKDEP